MADDRPSSPTPEERKKLDAEAKAKEDAEQAALPYNWTQTIGELDLTAPIPANMKGKDLDVKITKTTIKAGIKGQDPIIEVRYSATSNTAHPTDFYQGTLPHSIHPDDSTWTLETTPTGKELSIHLDKSNKMEWWAHVVTSAPKIDTSKISPENSKLSDLDGETRGMVEKMMWDQRQKEMGKPTSEEEKKMEMLRKFQEQHPEMDFSNAKMG
ncbi:Nuclear movement protein nudC [Teratosphaeria destructans]|uniref:Nuclear movement protein nudC n=1 Tax=Teratosphaeria destructans TaxID=418781 RepID=A0A9W7SQU7_9PEZI|nr:Nuclear movement protein nudC [Teratosphaeria destructans]